MAQYDDRSIQTAIDTIISEALGGGSPGMQAVAWVLANRMRLDPQATLQQIVTAPSQFSGYFAPGRDTLAARQDQALRASVQGMLMQAINQTVTDPTQGSTQFHATGSPAPGWAPSFQRVGDIGGNTFYRSGQPQTPGAPQPADRIANRLAPPAASPMSINWNGNDVNVQDRIKQVLNQAQQALDYSLSIRSGFRDPEHNAAVGGRPLSQHLSGNAVDISLAGLNDVQRSQLVNALIDAGALRLGAYSGNTGLHVDMASGYEPQADYGGRAYAMYDTSQNNMGSAPAWFLNGLNGNVDMPVTALDAISSAVPSAPAPFSPALAYNTLSTDTSGGTPPVTPPGGYQAAPDMFFNPLATTDLESLSRALAGTSEASMAPDLQSPNLAASWADMLSPTMMGPEATFTVPTLTDEQKYAGLMATDGQVIGPDGTIITPGVPQVTSPASVAGAPIPAPPPQRPAPQSIWERLAFGQPTASGFQRQFGALSPEALAQPITYINGARQPRGTVFGSGFDQALAQAMTRDTGRHYVHGVGWVWD